MASAETSRQFSEDENFGQGGRSPWPSGRLSQGATVSVFTSNLAIPTANSTTALRFTAISVALTTGFCIRTAASHPYSPTGCSLLAPAHSYPLSQWSAMWCRCRMPRPLVIQPCRQNAMCIMHRDVIFGDTRRRKR